MKSRVRNQTGVLAIALFAPILSIACGYGPTLKTFEDECELANPDMSLNIQLPRGDIEVSGDLPEGTRIVTGTLEVYDRGVSGWTLEPASLDDITFNLSGSGDSLRVELSDEAYKPNFYYVLKVHVPEDYMFYSTSAQQPNMIKTDEGEITVMDLRGGDMEHRDFEIWAGAPMGMFSHPPMTIKNVDGIILAGAYGPMTVSDCRAISAIFSSGSGDQLDLTLGNIAITEDALIHGGNGGTTIRLSRSSNFTFYNEIGEVNAFAPRGVVNKGDPVISGPDDVEYKFLPKQRIMTGTGAIGTFDVFVLDSRIVYELYD